MSVSVYVFHLGLGYPFVVTADSQDEAESYLISSGKVSDLTTVNRVDEYAEPGWVLECALVPRLQTVSVREVCFSIDPSEYGYENGYPYPYLEE